jgi:hypothetical protein
MLYPLSYGRMFAFLSSPVPTKQLSRPPSVAVGADYLTFGDLLLEPRKRIALAAERRYVHELIPLVIELKNHNVCLAAVDARMSAEIFDQEVPIDPDLLGVSRTCLRDVR